MLILRRFLAALTAPLIASVPAAFVEFAVAGQMPANFSDFLPVLHVVSRFGFAAALVIGVPAILALQRFRRFSFWSVLALGATLGVVVAVAVPLSGAPGTIGFTLACCALPGAVGAAWFWWIGGWSASPALPQDVGSDSDRGSLGATRWRRGVLVALATVALGIAAALLIPTPDLTRPFERRVAAPCPPATAIACGSVLGAAMGGGSSARAGSWSRAHEADPRPLLPQRNGNHPSRREAADPGDLHRNERS